MKKYISYISLGVNIVLVIALILVVVYKPFGSTKKIEAYNNQCLDQFSLNSQDFKKLYGTESADLAYKSALRSGIYDRTRFTVVNIPDVDTTFNDLLLKENVTENIFVNNRIFLKDVYVTSFLHLPDSGISGRFGYVNLNNVTKDNFPKLVKTLFQSAMFLTYDHGISQVCLYKNETDDNHVRLLYHVNYGEVGNGTTNYTSNIEVLMPLTEGGSYIINYKAEKV